MHRKSLAAFALAAIATSGAWAESPTVLKDTFVSTKSRAEVVAELHAHKKAGVNTYSISYNPVRNFQSSVSRDQVVAAYLADRDVVAAVHSEDGGSTWFAQHNQRHQDSATVVAGRPARAQ